MNSPSIFFSFGVDRASPAAFHPFFHSPKFCMPVYALSWPETGHHSYAILAKSGAPDAALPDQQNACQGREGGALPEALLELEVSRRLSVRQSVKGQ
jgi:hypothetical protein